MDVRSRYIARHGLVPWGLLAGAIAAFVVVRSAWRDRSAGAGMSAAGVVLVGGLCFVTWAAIAGWFIGAFLWETRKARQRTTRDRTRRSRRE
jgi:hypothetical protein